MLQWLVFEKLSNLVLKGEEALVHHRDDNRMWGVEITLNDPVFLRQMDEVSYDRLRVVMKPYRRTVHLPFYGLNLGCFDRWIADYSEQTLREGIDFCRAVGASRAVSHTTIPAYLGEDAVPKWADRFLEKMIRLEEYAAQNRVTVVWENTYEGDFVLFDSMIRAYSEVVFCLDVGHGHCFAKRPIADFVERWGKRIRHLHLHDNDGREDRHWPIGKGTIDFEEVVTLLPRTAADTIVFELDADDFRESRSRIERLMGALLTV